MTDKERGNTVCVGIDAVHFYTSHYYLSLDDLADRRGVDPKKFSIGIGQEKMGISPPNEDVVTLGANAALPLLKEIDTDTIDTLFFATESGVDQAKSGANFLHRLLQLPSHCRVIECKQACYSATAALRFACSMLSCYPDKKMLIIASDIARYTLNSPEEPTQGCGAVAMVLSANPRILTIDPEYGLYTEETYDFWRPNYRQEAMVNKSSTTCYLTALEYAWKNYQKNSSHQFSRFSYFCYHQPFTRMVKKAHSYLAKINPGHLLSEQELLQQIEPSLYYTRYIGNSYTASLYIGLISLLENSRERIPPLQTIGFFSYGSGCMGEYFSGTLVEGYEKSLYKEEHEQLIRCRRSLTCEEYEQLYQHSAENREKHSHLHLYESYQTGNFVLNSIEEEKRIYSFRS